MVTTVLSIIKRKQKQYEAARGNNVKAPLVLRMAERRKIISSDVETGLNRIKFVTDVSYVRILLEGIRRLDGYGMGTSHEAIQELINGLEFCYDPIFSMLHEEYDHRRINALQKWLLSEFGQLDSMDIDKLIEATRKGRIPSLIVACEVIENDFR